MSIAIITGFDWDEDGKFTQKTNFFIIFKCKDSCTMRCIHNSRPFPTAALSLCHFLYPRKPFSGEPFKKIRKIYHSSVHLTIIQRDRPGKNATHAYIFVFKKIIKTLNMRAFSNWVSSSSTAINQRKQMYTRVWSSLSCHSPFPRNKLYIISQKYSKNPRTFVVQKHQKKFPPLSKIAPDRLIL